MPSDLCEVALVRRCLRGAEPDVGTKLAEKESGRSCLSSNKIKIVELRTIVWSKNKLVLNSQDYKKTLATIGYPKLGRSRRSAKKVSSLDSSGSLKNTGQPPLTFLVIFLNEKK